MAATIRASTLKTSPATGARARSGALMQPAGNSFKALTVSNGNTKKCSAMMVWTPTNNKFFETFSYLPPLTADQIAMQVDYIVLNGWTPCLEFADQSEAYVGNASTVRFGSVASGYQDNRYWTMWKLPMFGCNDPSQVLKEISACERAFPDAYLRLVAFDAIRQVQITGFLVHRPASATEHRKVNDRSVSS